MGQRTSYDDPNPTIRRTLPTERTQVSHAIHSARPLHTVLMPLGNPQCPTASQLHQSTQSPTFPKLIKWMGPPTAIASTWRSGTSTNAKCWLCSGELWPPVPSTTWSATTSLLIGNKPLFRLAHWTGCSSLMLCRSFVVHTITAPTLRPRFPLGFRSH